MSTFFRLVGAQADDKSALLKREIAGIAHHSEVEQSITFEISPDEFLKVPTSPFIYWVRPAVRQMFRTHPQVESGGRNARHGGATLDDFRFLRVWPEVSPRSHNVRWRPFLKGGAIRGYWTDVLMNLHWQEDGRELKAYVSAVRDANGWGPQWSAVLNGHERYGQPGITWSARPHIRGYFAHVPSGCIFSHTGMMLFGSRHEHWSTLAILNSAAFVGLLHLLMARGAQGGQTLKYESGYVGIAPFPNITPFNRDKLAVAARRSWSLMRLRESIIETSRAFILPLTLKVRVNGQSWTEAERELNVLQLQIDEESFQLYGFDEQDQADIIASVNSEAGNANELNDDEADEPRSEQDEEGGADRATADLRSWLIGVSFGRFDPRLATGERAIPPEPEPFDPLPSRSPGMYPEGEEPADRPDILVDDEGHEKDMTADVQRWADRIGFEVPAEVRPWLAREFFPLHIKMYSKSRRKAPIYWQLATPSASYSVWIYIHAFTKDTLFRVQNDYVAGKLAHEERQLETLRAEAGPDPVTAQRKAIEAQEAFVEELRTFLDEVKRVAPLWTPNLDDGVIINFAPLWRLVPHHKPWQRELKSTWDELCAGKYDWAHLAMHLWPERVVPKCADDRSLAIAHDLEDVFWYQDDDEKWKAREQPTRPIDALVKERTSSAVKAALKSLMEAPEQAGGTRRRRGRRG